MFKEGINRRQRTLLPDCIEDYISEGHLARIISTVINNLNINKIISKFSSIGQNAYNPRILICILFYGYAIGIRSSRKLSMACENRLDFIYLARKLAPSYKVISEFRRENLEELKDVFKDIVQIGIGIGLVRIGNIKTSIDGTKIRANASSKKTKDEDSLKNALKEVETQINELFEEAEKTDEKEDKEYGNTRGDDTPKELSKLETQKQKIEEAIKTLQERKEAVKKEKLEKKDKLTKTEEKKIDNMKINTTDIDANYMKERNGCIKTNYNCQTSVDEKEQFIVANHVTTEPNDKNQLIPMTKKSEANLNTNVDLSKADAGYHSIENIKAMTDSEHDYLIDDPNKRRVDNPNHKFDKVNFSYDKEKDKYKCPANESLTLKRTTNRDNKIVKVYESDACKTCSDKTDCCGKKKNKRSIERREFEELVEENRERLLSEEGKEEYKKRMHTVEPPYGHIKFNLGYRHFLLRGIKKVMGEFNLICIGYNLNKIVKKIKTRGIDLSEIQQIALKPA